MPPKKGKKGKKSGKKDKDDASQKDPDNLGEEVEPPGPEEREKLLQQE